MIPKLCIAAVVRDEVTAQTMTSGLHEPVYLADEVCVVKGKQGAVVLAKPGMEPSVKLDGQRVEGLRVVDRCREAEIEFAGKRWRLEWKLPVGDLLGKSCPLCGRHFNTDEIALRCNRCSVGVHKTCEALSAHKGSLACPTVGCKGHWLELEITRSREAE